MINTKHLMFVALCMGFTSTHLMAQESATDPTVDAIIRSLGYMNEAQIVEFFERMNKSERVNALLSAGNAKGSPRTIEIDFLKDQNSQLMNFAANRVTAIQVLDQNGKPWPIKSFIPAPKGALEQKKIGKSGSIIAITPLKRHIRGNAILELEGVETPIHLRFETNEKFFDEPLTIKVRDYQRFKPSPGANSSDSYSTKGYTAAEIQYRPFLEGLIPASAREVKVQAPFDALVWRFGKVLVIKTVAELLYPGHRYRSEKGDIHLFVVDPIEYLEFTYQGRDTLISLEYQ